uniref:hypothetical protein n=1 Tax=uncultured Caulobacter sp. TaxID=158749 RepID=UPI0025CC50F1|nr:hypothetical protein [uncultured Caulobacter sp.]
MSSGLAAHAAETPIPAYDVTVRDRIQPQTEQLLIKLVKDGRKLELDGQPVFNGSDKFLPGKIAIGLADFLVTLSDNDPRLPTYLADFRKIARLTADDANDSWGAYYYLSALNKLREAGRLKDAVDPLTLAKLRVRLDWRMFVDVDTYALIDHPNNYYCVAFAIARLRTRMGWDDGAPAEKLYAKIAEHYDLYSGQYGFADETDGEGRFDRYSVLLAGEIAQRFIETGGKPPQQVLTWLRKSADVMLMRLDAQGQGFEYGRSLGPYGETALIETLTAAAVLDLLTPQEKELAYAYSARAAQRYAEFWQDPRTGSVNLWDGGRRTDDYRGKFRILGENLSLAHQYAYTSAHWARMGYAGKSPAADWAKGLATLPRRQVTWFARGDYDRLLVSVRDGSRMIALPVINGGESQHMHNPYFPIPFSPGMLAGSPDGVAPFLTPRLTLEDGSALMPLAYFKDAKVEAKGAKTTVSWRQDELDKMGERAPVADKRVTVETTYVLEPGRITRTDVFTPAAGVKVKDIELQFGSFSGGAQQAAGTTTFADGAVRRFSVEGLKSCQSGPVSQDGGQDKEYRSATGAMTTKVVCHGASAAEATPFKITWRLDYR